LSRDYSVVEDSEYCHAKELSLKNLTAIKLAECSQYSMLDQEHLMNLGRAILEEDLKPAFVERKVYDRAKFATYSLAFRILSQPGNVCIEFGHETNGGFACGDIKICLVRRLDPGFGAEASKKIVEAMRSGPIMAVKSGLQTRRQMDIDYMLEWIAKKRKMDIVYI